MPKIKSARKRKITPFPESIETTGVAGESTSISGYSRELPTPGYSRIDYNGATVYMEKSHTKNLGDFNSVKITVGITLPVDAPDELLKKIAVSFNEASFLVDKEMEDQFLALERETK